MLPYALAISNHATARERLAFLAPLMMAANLEWCSVTRGTVGSKASLHICVKIPIRGHMGQLPVPVLQYP